LVTTVRKYIRHFQGANMNIKDPSKHKSGKTRLHGLNLEQLADLLAKTAKNKEKAKIKNEMQRRNSSH
jgi:hypothetical protein